MHLQKDDIVNPLSWQDTKNPHDDLARTLIITQNADACIDQDVDELSQTWYDISEQDDSDKDNQLRDVLTEQFKQLSNMSLDDKMSYKEQLFDFFVHQELDYPLSFALAFRHLKWQDIADSIQVTQYPWKNLLYLIEEYQDKVPIFCTYEEFYECIKEYYPLVYRHYYPNRYKNRWLFMADFIRKSPTPDKMPILVNELTQLDALLKNYQKNNHQANHLYFNILNKDEQYKSLKNIVFGTEHQILSICLIIGLLVFVGYFILMLMNQTYWFDTHVLPILLFIGVLIVFWQASWRLFAPIQSDGHYTKQWIMIGNLVLSSLFLSQYAAYQRDYEGLLSYQHNSSYFLAHLLGFWLWRNFEKMFYHHRVPYYAYNLYMLVTIFVVIAVIYPLMTVLSQNSSAQKNIVGFSPLFWVVFFVPIFIHLINKRSLLNNVEILIGRSVAGFIVPLGILATFWSFNFVSQMPVVVMVFLMGYIWLMTRMHILRDNQ